MVSPCCGSSLQQGTKFIAMLSMMLSVAGIVGTSLSLFSFLLSSPSKTSEKPKDLEEVYEEEDFTSMGIKLFIMLIGFIFNLFLAILLFIAAEQKNLRICEVWLKVNILLFFLDLLLFIGSIYLGIAETPDYVINSSGIIYSVYEMWVVLAFINEIKSLKEAVSTCPTVNTTV